MEKIRQRLTVKEMLDIVTRSESVIRESDGADEHGELLADLKGLRDFTALIIGSSGQGCAADAVILELGDDAKDEAFVGYETICTMVASNVVRLGYGARVEIMGGNIWCVLIVDDARDDHSEWICGMSNETWGGDLIDVDGELVLIEGKSQHVTTEVPSKTNDDIAIARALIGAIEARKAVRP